ncbi:unnamed protein product [Cylicocyclus nassatus]|uniref:Uncharacterized protein n=1 Tax=Cylicocyclus nassatus TaxID=53992 RepID=A0AA36GZQ1_CYLNA|nr:unnamed protein product [Cylicocyclus nassatus]
MRTQDSAFTHIRPRHAPYVLHGGKRNRGKVHKGSLTRMAPKRKFRYEDTGVKKAASLSARLLESRENVRVIAQLRDRRPGERQFMLNEGDEVPGEHAGDMLEDESSAFDELPTAFEESSQSTSDFEEDTPVGDEEEPLSLSDRVLYYAALVEHSRMSKEAVRRMEKLMGVIYGKPPPFTVH